MRGEQREYETSLGDYKEVAGVYFPYSSETNAKGSPFKQKISIEKIEVNVALAESRFVEPRVTGQLPAAAPDASNLQPKPPEEKKPPQTEQKKPPVPLTRRFAAPSPDGRGIFLASLLPGEKVAEGRMRGAR